ncbi:hypothetical protein HNR56_002447 [Roseospira marina]|nr:hypothetical protein [Roseospira marina]MBB5087747.1 hypothetical protein [Roseospira marina]
MSLTAMIREGLALSALFVMLILWSILGHALIG